MVSSYHCLQSYEQNDLKQHKFIILLPTPTPFGKSHFLGAKYLRESSPWRLQGEMLVFAFSSFSMLPAALTGVHLKSHWWGRGAGWGGWGGRRAEKGAACINQHQALAATLIRNLRLCHACQVLVMEVITSRPGLGLCLSPSQLFHPWFIMVNSSLFKLMIFKSLFTKGYI